MKKSRMIWSCIVLMLLLSSCGENPQTPALTNQETQLKESLEKANRYLVNEEEEDILNYINRHHYEMTATGTGLRYQVLHEGEGDTIRPGQVVSLEYELRNLMGDVIYTSDKDGVKSFVVGQSNVESGLDEAVRHLRKGDVAVIIIPSHLGFGLLGDQKSIPERATLIYTLRVSEVN